MTGHRQYKVTDYRFGQMILGLREKIGLTQNEVANALEVSRRTIQHWEAGTAFPDIPHLKNLIAYYLENHGFNKGLEHDEALALWGQAEESASRRKSMFDEHWFDELLQLQVAPIRQSTTQTPVKDESANHNPRIDWGDSPDVIQVYGREQELSELAKYVIDEQCRVVAVLGMGGIGKTTLVTKFAQDFATQFDYIIWRSLHNAPDLPNLLIEIFQVLSPVYKAEPSIPLLIELLKQHRCLLILDNVETLHRAGNLAGIYQEGFEEYQVLFQTVARTRHKSCLILTSRGLPLDVEMVEGRASPVRVMKLAGLTSTASQVLLTDKGLFGPSDAWDVYVHYYTGNPLALKIASTTVRDLFGGDLAAFLREAPVTLHTLNHLLGNQFEHLSALEREILLWLAIERDPVELHALQRNFLQDIPSSEILAGLLSLLQRSLIERSDQGAVFSLLPVLLEFVTDRLVNSVVEQISGGNLALITHYALIKSQSIDHIRDGQVRMILSPVLALLRRHFGSQALLVDHLRQMVSKVRNLPGESQGYAGGNLVNLLIHLNTTIREEDFSGLSLRQIYLQGVEAQDANFSGTEFIDSRFTEPLEAISAMTVSPSGTYLAAGTYNGHVRCWRVADGKPVWTVTNATRAWSLKFSPDESMLACSHFRGRVSLWEVPTGRRIHIFEGHVFWVHALAFHPNGQVLASGGVDTHICIWDLHEKKLIKILKGHTARVWSLEFSPDGELLASGAGEENIYIWDWKTGSTPRVLHHNSAGRVNLAFHPNGDWIATACEQDPDIDLWNTHTGNRFASIASHSHSPTSIAFSPNGSYLVSGGQDGSIEIWQVAVDRQPQFIKMLVGHQNNVSVITCSRNNFLASLSYGENIKLWNLESGKLLREIEGHNRLIGANAFSPDGKLLLQGDSSGKIRVWDMLKHCYIASIQGHRGPVWVIAFHPNGKTFSTAGDDRSVRLWDIDSLNCIQTHLGHTSPIFAMTYNQDGSILASGGISRDIFLWDTNPEASSLELNFIETPDDVWSLAFDPGGENLMSGHMNGTAIIWDVKTGKKKVTLQHDENTIPVGAARFSSDGKILITSSNHQLLKFWDVETWECLRTIAIESEGNRTNAVAIGEDARIIATGSTEPVVHLRRFGPDGTLAETFVLAGHANRVWGVALSADERYLASSDEEGTTLISDVQAGRVLEKIMLDRPYERMNVSGVTGLNAAEHAALKALGAIETAQGDPH